MLNSILYKNARLSFYEKGQGEAVVLLHGFLESLSMWNSIAEQLSKTHKIICIDLLGHGKTESISTGHSMEEMADAVNAIIEFLNIEKATFIGHSMGGYVALAYAEKYMDKVYGLCLINSTSQPDSDERKKNRVRAIEMAKSNYNTLIKLSIENLFTLQTKKVFTKEIENVKKEALKITLENYIASTKAMLLRKNRFTVLKNFSFKKVLIVGEKDTILDSKSIILEAEKTKTSIKILSGGHMSHIENKEELLLLLKDFLH